MQKSFFVLSLGLAGVILAVQAAQGQSGSCAQRGQVVERLQSKYGETRRSVGLAPNNGVVETYASAETGSWTIIVTMPNGMSCLVAAGEAFEPVEDGPLPSGKKT